VDIFSILLSRDTTIQSAFSFCLFCTDNYMTHQIPLSSKSNLNLDQIRKFASMVRKTSRSVPSIAALTHRTTNIEQANGLSPSNNPCQFLYKKLDRTKLVGCRESLIFAENVAEKINASLEYYSFDDITEYQFPLFMGRAPKHYSGIISYGLDYKFPTEFLESFVLKITPYFLENQFIYCTKFDERESFNSQLWTVPFDRWSWTFLGISCFCLVLQLRGQWFPIYSILMRQSCTTLTKNKSLLVFILASIIFTYGYEGVISSLLTVEPPVKTFKTLRELIDNGYKILSYGFSNAANEHIQEVFTHENITANLSSTFLDSSSDLFNYSEAHQIDLLLNSKSAQMLSTRTREMYLGKLKQDYPESKCHPVRHTTFPSGNTIMFYGDSRAELNSVARSMKEAGLLSLYADFIIHVLTTLITFSTSARIREELQPKPFSMEDWKILSIFLGCAAILGLTVGIFAMEIAFKGWKNVRSIAKSKPTVRMLIRKHTLT